MLELKGVSVHYGQIQVLHSINLIVPKGNIVAIIGANGAGKTTVLRTISGLVKPSSGSILFEKKEIQGQKVESVVCAGIAHVPQGRRVFPGLTVRENLAVATAPWRKIGMSISYDLEKVYLLFNRLKEREKQLAWSLSGGEQQMLAVGRALMARPKLLVLDEPSLGLAPLVVSQLFETISSINREGMTILIVEQNAVAALGIASYAYVLELGKLFFEGKAEELLSNDTVKKAYLGDS